MASSMMHIARWNKILIILACVLSFVYAAPNLLSKDTREHLAATKPGWMPVKGLTSALIFRVVRTLRFRLSWTR